MKKLLVVIPLVFLLCFTFSCQQAEEVDEDIISEVPIESGYAEVNGANIYYELAGSGDSIVFIHGNIGDNRHWDEQFEIFAKKYKVLRYDVRGFGKSSLPVEGEVYRHHNDLKMLLEHLGISKAHICGLSMGSGLAVDFVIAYPEMSSSLIAVGPWVIGFDSPSAQELYSAFGDIPSLLKEKGKVGVIEYFFSHPMYQRMYSDSKIAKRMEELYNDYSFWHFQNQDPVQYIDPPATKRLEQINQSTLIVTAEYDIKPCREVADLMELSIPNAIKIDMPDASHVMNMERPDEFNKAVFDFLNKLE
jgi:pimeloyl-ACP methyl ester carboxylesterase